MRVVRGSARSYSLAALLDDKGGGHNKHGSQDPVNNKLSSKHVAGVLNEMNAAHGQRNEIEDWNSQDGSTKSDQEHSNRHEYATGSSEIAWISIAKRSIARLHVRCPETPNELANRRPPAG